MTDTDQHLDDEQHEVDREEAAGELGGTIVTVGLFVVMVAFFIGCWQLGWFG